MDANSSVPTAAPFVGRCPENSLTCARILSPAEVVVIAIDVPVLLFHTSVFYFILRQILGSKQDFKSAFYRLYAAMSVVDVIHVIDVSFVEFTYTHFQELRKYFRCTFAFVRLCTASSSIFGNPALCLPAPDT